jgi:hypothetical protein
MFLFGVDCGVGHIQCLVEIFPFTFSVSNFAVAFLLFIHFLNDSLYKLLPAIAR